MKKIIPLALWLLSPVVLASPEATEIVRRGETHMRGGSIQALMDMKIVRPSFTRELKLRVWTQGTKNAVVTILRPAKEEGITSLRSDTQMWNYLPKTDQVNRDVETVHGDLRKAFPPPGVEALTWKQVQRHVMAMVELDKAVNRLLMFIILSVASLGVANTILMSILERTREFGVMMTVGASKGEIVRLIVGETLLVAAVGLFAGNLLGMGVTLIFGKTGFDLAWLTSQKLVIDGAIIQTVSYPSIQWRNSLSVTVVVMALSLVASVIPARHIARLRAVSALRAV